MGWLVIRPGLYEGAVPATQTILQVLLNKRVALHYSCRRGLCGQDLIRVLAGWEHLNPIGELEAGTLQLLRANGKSMRLACCARIIGSGKVEVELVH